MLLLPSGGHKKAAWTSPALETNAGNCKGVSVLSCPKALATRTSTLIGWIPQEADSDSLGRHPWDQRLWK